MRKKQKCEFSDIDFERFGLMGVSIDDIGFEGLEKTNTVSDELPSKRFGSKPTNSYEAFFDGLYDTADNVSSPFGMISRFITIEVYLRALVSIAVFLMVSALFVIGNVFITTLAITILIVSFYYIWKPEFVDCEDWL